MKVAEEQEHSNHAIYAWLFFGLVTASVLLAYGIQLSRPAVDGNRFVQILEASWGLIPITFAFVGALIIARQPRNVIGLLMMLPALTFAIPAEQYLAGFAEVPTTKSLFLYVAIWFNNWSWVLLVFPILFILVLFPSGEPPSRRWRALIYVGIGMMLTTR